MLPVFGDFVPIWLKIRYSFFARHDALVTVRTGGPFAFLFLAGFKVRISESGKDREGAKLKREQKDANKERLTMHAIAHVASEQRRSFQFE
jgi:hypothetical protein